MNLTLGDTIGKYTIERYVGSGAFGAVYLCHDNLMDRDCAVKFVKNDAPNSFVAHFEAQILHKCRHDRIVEVHGVDVVRTSDRSECAAICMEYIAGGSADKLNRSGHISVRRAIKIVIDVLFALEHAHHRSVIHRDVKPPNILIARTRSKLSDFGLATDAAGATLGASGAGTPIYCAPEVLTKDLTNKSTDLFATGVTLFELANNYTDLGDRISSWDAIEAGRVLTSIGHRNYMPRRLRLVCTRACAVDPAKRYDNATEMRQALEALHVVQDWHEISPDYWKADIDGNEHEMTLESGRHGVEMVYTVNGRRKNKNCSLHNNKGEARAAQRRWVYEHTF